MSGTRARSLVRALGKPWELGAKCPLDAALNSLPGFPRLTASQSEPRRRLP